MHMSERHCEWCPYTTRHRQNLSIHRKICKLRPVAPDPEKELLREQVSSLQLQLMTKDERIRTLELMLGQQMLELKQELKQTKKRKDNYASKSAIRKKRTEPAA